MQVVLPISSLLQVRPAEDEKVGRGPDALRVLHGQEDRGLEGIAN